MGVVVDKLDPLTACHIATQMMFAARAGTSTDALAWSNITVCTYLHTDGETPLTFTVTTTRDQERQLHISIVRTTPDYALSADVLAMIRDEALEVLANEVDANHKATVTQINTRGLKIILKLLPEVP